MIANSGFADHKINMAHLNPLTVLKAISVLESDPCGRDSASAMAIIVGFAQASPEVDVLLDSGFFPWVKRTPEIKKSDILMAAFIAGDIRPQLEKQVKQDHPVDGILFMCKIYTVLRKSGRIEEIAEPEKWATMDRNEIKKLIPLIRYMK